MAIKKGRATDAVARLFSVTAAEQAHEAYEAHEGKREYPVPEIYEAHEAYEAYEERSQIHRMNVALGNVGESPSADGERAPLGLGD